MLLLKYVLLAVATALFAALLARAHSGLQLEAQAVHRRGDSRRIFGRDGDFLAIALDRVGDDGRLQRPAFGGLDGNDLGEMEVRVAELVQPGDDLLGRLIADADVAVAEIFFS